MKSRFDHCIKAKTDAFIKVVDERNKKRKVIIKNPERRRHLLIRVDDCVITSGKRVDYLLVEGDRASVLIELKGAGVEHACDQIRESMMNSDLRCLMPGRIGIIVVSRRYPSFDTYVRKAQEEFYKKYKASFRVICDQRAVAFDEII